MFNKILIANRGEIAVRVIRACQEMGIRAVAVYSEVDRNAIHVQLADEAWFIGPPAASESYLRGDKILKVALQSGAEAIHPGYGFLSENAEFATAVEEAGLVWIGPPAAAIRSMGSKTKARSIMMGSGVPVVPGTEGSVEDTQEAIDFANKIGYPVLIKAAMGGGGKGMRVVRSETD
ncbi:MAG TPA: acetyl-CoA carboxylase biotin carboxylase subunit, partial [Bacteroidetes bacterium]|nr:acetyl-CoA carboxylase biotin carboxylase subunit [Bacteroidota bacterium]HEX05678.1 acetyl-CoA carboxylase biotin carboxylase subunit [Bacteroidota bacterium]